MRFVAVSTLTLAFALIAAGCRSAGATGLKEAAETEGAGNAEGVMPAQGVPMLPDLPADLSVDQLRSMPREQWQQLFARGEAREALIPSRDHEGVLTKGKGFPQIFQVVPLLNGVANQIWNGKNFITASGDTTLKNQFVQGTGTSQVQLFDAHVVIDPQTRVGDGAPVILLDYRVSGVPGINAIRDEIRLVREKTFQESGRTMRRRLYLGPTFLLPEQLPTPASLAAAPWEFTPMLWFALEFVEPVTPAP